MGFRVDLLMSHKHTQSKTDKVVNPLQRPRVTRQIPSNKSNKSVIFEALAASLLNWLEFRVTDLGEKPVNEINIWFSQR